MNRLYCQILKFFKSWFTVDSRALGAYRIILGLLCFFDISRRWSIIDIFYINGGLIDPPSTNSYYKYFTLLTTFTSSWEVHLFFVVGLISSIFLAIGYKTKISHFISAIILISIHNRAVMLENAGDMFFNSMIVWTLFLPLGITFSVDSLRRSIQDNKENNIEDLNNRELGYNKPVSIYSFAFFAVLYQISAIYFFTGLNKSGYDWQNGSAVYKMYQLDTYLTSFGYLIRDYINYPISKMLTFFTLYLEFSIPILLFIPFYSYVFRTIAIICLTIFHLMIRMSVKIGLFSQVMIASYILLFDTKVIDKIKLFFATRYNRKKYILFYDSDCGFCHFTVRIIKRLDLFHCLHFSDRYYKGKKPDQFDVLYTKTAIVYDEKQDKIWIKGQAFGKVLSVIPFGVFISWIFFIPGLSQIINFIYDQVAINRIYISSLFGLPACGIDKKVKVIDSPSQPLPTSQIIVFKKYTYQFFTFLVISTMIIAGINYNLVANESVNDYMEKKGYEKFRYNSFLKRIAYYPRMVQRWNMFSPTVLTHDKTLIVEAILENGDSIDVFTGKRPVLDNLNYLVLWKNNNQFWRKYFHRLAKNKKEKQIKSFESWLKRKSANYFSHTLRGERVKKFNIWYLTQRNQDINSKKTYKVTKRLLSSKSSNKSNKNKKKLNF